MYRRVDDHLADTDCRRDLEDARRFDCRFRRVGAHRREAILEDNDIVVVGRNLGGEGAVAGRAERAEIGRRQERAVLAMCGGGDPFAQQRIPA